MKVTFDDVIELLGGFGKYQKRLYIIVIAPTLWCAMLTVITVFTIGEQDHRCQIPQLHNDTYETQGRDHEIFINGSIPLADDGMYEHCTLILNRTDNTTEQQECESWVYDKSLYTSTLVSEFDLVCKRTIYQSHASMSIFGGALLGGPIIGIIGDTFGRKIACCLSLTLMFVSHLGTAFIPNYGTFIVMRFIAGIGDIGYWNSAKILGFEMAGPKKRVWTGMLMELVWCVGEYLTVFVAYFVRDWRTLQLILAAPLGIVLIYWKALDESPRWLLNKGKKKEAGQILATVGKVNKRNLPDDIDLYDELDAKESLPTSVKKLLKSRVMLSRTIIMLFNWITVYAGYYGLTLNTGKIEGDVYVNFTISITMEVFAYSLCLVFLDRIGRRALHCSCMIIGGAACLCSIFPVVFGNETHSWITTTLSMIGKLGVSAAIADIYVLSAELFPTSIRSLVLGLSCILGQVGSVASPYIADLGMLIPSQFGKALPLLVFGAMMMSSGIMALFLPETMNMKLPEMFEDAVALKRNRRKTKDNSEVGMALTREHLSN